MSINKILINITEENTQSRKRQSHSIMNYPTFLQRNEDILIIALGHMCKVAQLKLAFLYIGYETDNTYIK